MRLIGLAVALIVSLFLATLAADAQQAGKVYRIGALSDVPNPASAPLAAAMRELGWVEGQNFIIERRNAEARERLPALATELVRLKVDLIFALGTSAAQAA
jgi:putative ABC transport system substrate-binding protein